MFVKICGITSEDDALVAVAMGADAVGFVFAPSPRQIAPQKVYDITRRLPPEIITVGVFRDEHPARVIEIVDRAGLKAAQLHGRETPDMASEVAQSVPKVWKAFAAGVDDFARISRYTAIDTVLVDAPSPGSGKVFDWTLLSEVPDTHRVILAGGLTPDNVADAVRQVRPWGVDVSSGVERSPGVKDMLKIKAFVSNARSAAPAGYESDDDMPYDWRDE